MFYIASNQFGYLMFFCPEVADCCVTDQRSDAYCYSLADDVPADKLAYWRGYAISQGLDPDSVQIVFDC